MEPMGIERHRRRSPRRLSERERVNGASGKRCDIDAAKRRSQSENWEIRVNQSKPKLKHVPECQKTRLENRSRRESNPHLRFRKPPFYPLNYGNNDLERINGLNGDGQDAVAVRGDFSSGKLRTRLSAACLRVSLRGVFPCESIWLPRLKRKFSLRSRMCCSPTSSVTRSCLSISNE